MSSVYDIVKSNIVSRLEESIKTNDLNFEWMKPWNGSYLTRNFKSKKKYNGINSFLLPLSGNYLTFKQIKELGGKLKKGAKGSPIVFWKPIEKEKEEEAKENKPKFVCRYYLGFHQKDIEGIDFEEGGENINLEPKYELADKVIDKYRGECTISRAKGLNRACYSKSASEEVIILPTKSNFKNIDLYYSTIFHEMIHSTGHKSRLDRKTGEVFADEAYSKEELIAELGSCILMAFCNIGNKQTEENSINYLKGWLTRLKEMKSNELLSAFQQAQKAADYILEKTVPLEVALSIEI